MAKRPDSQMTAVTSVPGHFAERDMDMCVTCVMCPNVLPDVEAWVQVQTRETDTERETIERGGGEREKREAERERETKERETERLVGRPPHIEGHLDTWPCWKNDATRQ